MSATKSFAIDKWLVYEAYQAVKANAGSAGVDRQSIGDFEKDLKGNLYKIWNRMSSGSYLPPPVKAVSIPKKNGGERILGVPTVSDRVAQMVVKKGHRARDRGNISCGLLRLSPRKIGGMLLMLRGNAAGSTTGF